MKTIIRQKVVLEIAFRRKLGLAVCMLAVLPQILHTQEAMKIAPSDLANLYKGCHNWQEKRDFAISLIDQEVISRGKSATAILSIFGRDAHTVSGDPAHKSRVIVRFADQQEPIGVKYNAYQFIGWYLVIESSDLGQIENYYLSNLHK
jgi:hypothetical protein